MALQNQKNEDIQHQAKAVLKTYSEDLEIIGWDDE